MLFIAPVSALAILIGQGTHHPIGQALRQRIAIASP